MTHKLIVYFAFIVITNAVIQTPPPSTHQHELTAAAIPIEYPIANQHTQLPYHVVPIPYKKKPMPVYPPFQPTLFQQYPSNPHVATFIQFSPGTAFIPFLQHHQQPSAAQYQTLHGHQLVLSQNPAAPVGTYAIEHQQEKEAAGRTHYTKHAVQEGEKKEEDLPLPASYTFVTKTVSAGDQVKHYGEDDVYAGSNVDEHRVTRKTRKSNNKNKNNKN